MHKHFGHCICTWCKHVCPQTHNCAALNIFIQRWIQSNIVRYCVLYRYMRIKSGKCKLIVIHEIVWCECYIVCNYNFGFLCNFSLQVYYMFRFGECQCSWGSPSKNGNTPIPCNQVLCIKFSALFERLLTTTFFTITTTILITTITAHACPSAKTIPSSQIAVHCPWARLHCTFVHTSEMENTVICEYHRFWINSSAFMHGIKGGTRMRMERESHRLEWCWSRSKTVISTTARVSLYVKGFYNYFFLLVSSLAFWSHPK